MWESGESMRVRMVEDKGGRGVAGRRQAAGDGGASARPRRMQ